MHNPSHFSHHGNTPSCSTLPSRTATPSSQPPIPEESTKFSHRLKHLFDAKKTANFHVTVIIHELANVPQLEGKFAVDWKFRGKSPSAKDAAHGHAPRTKPSLPNLKLQTIHPSPSSSNLSVKTSSTSSSPATPRHSSSIHSMQLPSRAPTPALSINPNSVSMSDKIKPLSPTRPKISTSDLPRPDKKQSEPTPLRESTGPLHVTAESPELMLQYDQEDDSGLDNPHPNRAKDIASDMTNAAYMSHNDKKGLLPPPTVGAGSRSMSTNFGRNQMSQAYSRPPLRSGTGPSVSVILDSIPNRAEQNLQRPKPPPRNPSYGSSNDGSHTSDGPSSQQQRSASGPMSRNSAAPKSSTRKGSTPVSALRAHTCKWNFEIQHTIKVPLGKSIPISSSGTATPRVQGTAPVVGDGTLSESGLRLVVQQYPSKSATNASPAVGDKNGMASVIHAVHHVQHNKDGNNPSERNSGNSESEKTLFGTVDVDLAAFAGKGKMTRSFLLRGSRTNATIKMTVDMRWVGGEERWAAPPMQEGHHVTGIRDLIGEPEDRIHADLQLARTPSNASSSSSIGSSHSRSNPSINYETHHAGKSCASLVTGTAQTGYKSYEHHLRANPTPNTTHATTPDRSGSLSTQDMVRKHTLRHRANQSRHFKQVPEPSQFGMHDLAPDVVVEAVFNPRPATEETPFTYVPAPVSGMEGYFSGLQRPEAIFDDMFRVLEEEHGIVRDKGDNQRPGRGTGQKEGRAWGLRAIKAKKDKKAAATPN